MNRDFIKEIFILQHNKEAVPTNEQIAQWAEELICILYPQRSTKAFASEQAIREALGNLEQQLLEILNATTACYECNNHIVARKFFEEIAEIHRLLNTDVEAIVEGDPAAHSAFEVIRAYPGFYALCYYRIAHALHKLEVPLLPRILTEQAHSRTGIDIHPAAELDEFICIDHGTGIVIGETARIGKHVKIYQGVTLGSLSVSKDMAHMKRHPTVEDHVVLYSGATILGGTTVIGHHSVIGGNVWLTSSVPAGSLVYHNPEITVIEGKLLNT